MENPEQYHELVSPRVSEAHLEVVRGTVPTASGNTTRCTCADRVVAVHESSYPSYMTSHVNATRQSDAATRGGEVHAPVAHVKSPRWEQNTVCLETNAMLDGVLTLPPPHPAYPSLPLEAALAQYGFWESSTALTSELSPGPYEPASTPQHGIPWEYLSTEACYRQDADSLGYIGNEALGTSIFSPGIDLSSTSTLSTDIGDPAQSGFPALREGSGTQTHSLIPQCLPPCLEFALSHDVGASVISPFHAEISSGESPQSMSGEERMNGFEFTSSDTRYEMRYPEAKLPTHLALFEGLALCGENGMRDMASLLQHEQSRHSGQRPSHHLLPTMRCNSSDEILMTRIGWYPTPQSDILAEAFTEASHYPSPALGALLDDVTNSSFVLGHVQEPSIAHMYSIGVLARIVDLPGCPSIKLGNSQRSLFTVFVDSPEYRCLFCGSCKSSLARALGCVRMHLGHRPFGCTGCDSCNILNGYARFSTSALLKDHINGQQKNMECIRCHTKLRRGGMRRHWQSMHKAEKFPDHIYSKYRRNEDDSGSIRLYPTTL